MTRITKIKPEFVQFIPATLQPGILYISEKYRTASHLCCCGCGSKVVTPLKPGGWALTHDGDTVTLRPSIGSWKLPCRSHYVITRNQIILAPQWTKAQIEAGWKSDLQDRQQHFDVAPKNEGLWRRFVHWLLG